MGLAIIAFLLSIGVGLFLDCIVPGLGTTAAVSIIGGFIVYSLNRKK